MRICRNFRACAFSSLLTQTHQRTSQTLRSSRRIYQTASIQKEEKTPLLRQLRQRIIANGPLSVHDYMANVLTNPQTGYYMHRDVFGVGGDFTTSPEISQMFGEMIGVWMLNEWLKAGSPQQVQMIEVGPGRGTLVKDILRVLTKYGELANALTVHLVEVSPHLAKIQEERLCGTSTEEITGELYYKEAKTRLGPHIRWYKDIHVVPQESYSFFLAHEFLDALPVHKFVRTYRGWREVLVDLDESVKSPLHLRFVMAPNRTPSTILIDSGEKRNHVEICPQAGMFVQHVAKRLENHGGASLIVDYGHVGEKSDTLRAFRQHQLHEPLSLPGWADLTADVDFSYLRRCVENQVLIFGPVTQRNFLTSMGMGVRLKKLLEVVRSREEGEQLVTAYDMLINPRHMGERFKFMAMLPKNMAIRVNKNPPAGFEAELSMLNR